MWFTNANYFEIFILLTGVEIFAEVDCHEWSK